MEEADFPYIKHRNNNAIVDYTSPVLCTPVTLFRRPVMRPIVNLPNDDRATDIGNMHKNLVEIARVVPEISSRTDRHTDDILIAILRNLSRGQSNKQRATGIYVLKEQNTVFGIMD